MPGIIQNRHRVRPALPYFSREIIDIIGHALEIAVGRFCDVKSSNSGKALYGCIANVLDRLSNEISDVKVPAAQSALRTAASKLRAAANTAQALSAIAQCRAAISSAISLARTIGRGGSSGLDAIAGVLSHAASLIQSKG
ncbi:hypothetical protein [Bradyrhizobium lablabi]|uniref:hypothetical protein n=1 Tax=Bradyrhizobium lablabi TaxID=722472 RepID=UPI001FCE0BBA|nr:hypothetical protein [Bradyrhizobium lablabi]